MYRDFSVTDFALAEICDELLRPIFISNTFSYYPFLIQGGRRKARLVKFMHALLINNACSYNPWAVS